MNWCTILFISYILCGCSQKQLVTPPGEGLFIDLKKNEIHSQYRESIKLSDVPFRDQSILTKKGSVVDDQVGHLGGYYTFSLMSSRRKYDIIGRTELIKIKHEFEVLRLLQSKTSANYFLDGVSTVGKNITNGLWSLFSKPIHTSENIYSASGKLIKKLSVVDGLNDFFSDSPEKRALADKLNLDVYSYSPEVQLFLRNAAKHYSRGQLFGKGMTWLIPASPLSLVISAGGLNAESETFLSNKSPEEVARYSRESLLSMGCSEILVQGVLDNAYINPRSLFYMTQFIENMKNVEGAGHIPLEYIISAQSRNELTTVFYQLELYSELHQKYRIAELFNCGDLIGVRRQSNISPMVLAPYDYFELNSENKAVISRLLELSPSRSELWCSGAIDNSAQIYLLNNDISFRANYAGPQ